MCGITGVYNLSKKRRTESVKIIKQMVDTLVHRGPDDEGYFIDEKITMGHRRLSIIDLSKAGHQPMFYDHDNLVIVYNGEIYNYIELRAELVEKGYKFKSKTDTEVILAAYKAWGINCQERFNGMWAFVIYDRQKDILFGSRDRFGVKPFYYYWNKGSLIFASEIKAILAHPAVKTKPNNPSVHDYLVFGLIDHQEKTLFENIFELRGGHYLILKNDKLTIKKYWGLGAKSATPKKDEEYVQKFQELFRDAVKLRLRSDVPIGTCLSGGLDSSAIVCQINKLLREEGKIDQVGLWQKTFSACYNSAKYADIDEKAYIDEVIRRIKVKPSYIYPNPKGLVKEIKKLIWHHDLPLLTSSAYAQWCVFKLAHQHKIKVMLDGQGSDETLAGYLTFFPVYFTSLKDRHQYRLLAKEIILFLQLHYRQVFANQIHRFLSFPLIKGLQKGIKPNLKDIYLGSYFDRLLFNQDWLNQNSRVKLKKRKARTIKEQTTNLLLGKGLATLLRYEDRNSMAFSIESRTPFLDYRLVNFIFNLPDNQKIRHGRTKWIMRQALKNILPKKILNRHDKIGFDTPEETWLKSELSPVMRQVFASKKFAQRPYFNAQKVQESFDKYISGEPINYQLFWRIFNLELWLEEHFDETGDR